MSRATECPYCQRTVGVVERRYNQHPYNGTECPLSRQYVMVTGHGERDYENRAVIVADLAWQVQDEDPRRVWHYLTSLPGNELQQLMMLALAAIPTDRHVEELWAWVAELPVARTA